MARAALTPQQVETFRRRAVDVATRMFVAQGYDGLTMRALANELGVSPMTPYRYFEDKDALFTAVRIDATRRFADEQQDSATAAEPGIERLMALARAYLRFAVQQPEAYRIIFELRPDFSSDNAELAVQHGRAFSFLLEATREITEAGHLLGDPLTNAHLLWSQVHGIVSLHLSGKLTMGRSFEQLCAAMEQLVRNWMQS